MTTYNQPNDRLDTSDETRVHQVSTGPGTAYYESPYEEDLLDAEARQRQRFGGVNWGAGFYASLVTVAVAILLAATLAAVVAALGGPSQALPASAESSSATTGLTTAAVVLGILLVAYYAGGYVAGRMSRFDGGRQGFATWLMSLLFTGLAVGAGLLYNSQYPIVDSLDVTTPALPAEVRGLGGVLVAVVALLGTLLAAVSGGKVGCRYHRKVDRVGYLAG